MLLVSLEELSRELSVSCERLKELIEKNIIIPYGGSARLGKPMFSRKTLPQIRNKLRNQL